MEKFVYMFSEGKASMRNLLGGKGANLAEMTGLGLPVPRDARDQMLKLEKATGIPLPRALRGLFDCPVLHEVTIPAGDMAAYVREKAKRW